MTDPILYLVGEYPSLSETFIEREVTGLRARGLDITVLPLNGASVMAGVAVTPRVSAELRSVWRALRAEPEQCTVRRAVGVLLRACGIAARDRRFRHIHAHFLGLPATVAYCLARLWRVPYSVTAHARDIYVERTPRVVVAEAALRTTCTEANAVYLAARYPGAPFLLIRHGLDIETYACDRAQRVPGPSRILAVGRLVEKKGFVDLIRACGLLRERGVAFDCTIVGEGPQRGELERAIHALGLGAHVRLTGARTHAEMPTVYRNADLFVVPSIEAGDGDRDGVPNVILEAMASGLPVIATDAGSIAEVVRSGSTGVVVPQRAPQSLADAMEGLISHPLRGNVLAGAATSLMCDEFAADLWLDRLHVLFRQARESSR